MWASGSIVASGWCSNGECIAWVDLNRGLSLSTEAFLLATKGKAGVGGVDRDSILGSAAFACAFLNAILAEGHLLADADVTLDLEVAELAALGAGLVIGLLA